jgi:hypothetical protein
MYIISLQTVQKFNVQHIPGSCLPNFYFQLLQKLAFTHLQVSATHRRGANTGKTQTAYRMLVNGKNIYALCNSQMIYNITKTIQAKIKIQVKY